MACHFLQYLSYLHFQIEENIKSVEKQELGIGYQLQ